MLEVKNVRCGYDNNEIIKGVSFNVEPGSNLCIVGPNGCGKSTLLKSIANLLNYKGSILLNGKEISKFRIGNAFLGFDVLDGDNDIKLVYKIPYLGLGLFISCSSVILLSLEIYLLRKKSH